MPGFQAWDAAAAKKPFIVLFLTGTFFPAQIEVLEIKKPDDMHVAELVASGQLLKQVHVAQLQVVVCGGIEFKPDKKAVLIEVVVHDPFAQVDVHFIVHYCRKRMRTGAFAGERDFIKDVIADPVVKMVAFCQSGIVADLSAVSLFEAYPLHQAGVRVLGVPLQLLPGAVLRLRDVLVAFCRKMVDVGVTGGGFRNIVNVIGKAEPRNALRQVLRKVFFRAQVQVGPNAELIGKTGLIEISEPQLFYIRYCLCGLRVCGRQKKAKYKE
jgi:hypothetical protein